MITIDILKILAADNNIGAYIFHSFPKKQLLQDKIEINKFEEKQIKKALKIRDEYRLPFWDSVMLTFFQNENPSLELLKASQFHNPRNDTFAVKKEDLDMFWRECNENKEISYAINSQVILPNGGKAHIPLIDFHIPLNRNNEFIVEEVIRILNLGTGYILNSGESYHYIGSQILTWDSLLTLLSKGLLFSPIIDRAWVAHQILERSCSLRIGKKHGTYPTLIKKIGIN